MSSLLPSKLIQASFSEFNCWFFRGSGRNLDSPCSFLVPSVLLLATKIPKVVVALFKMQFVFQRRASFKQVSFTILVGLLNVRRVLLLLFELFNDS